MYGIPTNFLEVVQLGNSEARVEAVFLITELSVLTHVQHFAGLR
jgi:hypothetical protein